MLNLNFKKNGTWLKSFGILSSTDSSNNGDYTVGGQGTIIATSTSSGGQSQSGSRSKKRNLLRRVISAASSTFLTPSTSVQTAAAAVGVIHVASNIATSTFLTPSTSVPTAAAAGVIQVSSNVTLINNPAGVKTSQPKEKRIKIRSIRNIMNLGRKRQRLGRERSRDSSNDDVKHSSQILETDEKLSTKSVSMTSTVSACSIDSDGQHQTKQFTSNTSCLLSEQSRDQSIDIENKGKMRKAMPRKSDYLKSQDFQICINIIEARQLAGLNISSLVCIQIGDQKKYTSVVVSTSRPYYNEYFVFDFHMPPIILFDLIITLSALQSRKILPNKLIGSFKLDVATVWTQNYHQFYHKWALLSDPNDFYSGPKGYIKCDIGIIGKGDTIRVPPQSEKDTSDIQANLLLPDGIPLERQVAKFIIKIYRADGLPRMNFSLMSNVKKAFSVETKDLVSPYVKVSFAGLSGKTSIKKNAYAPVWNEQVVFTEMFPTLCQRIKIQLRDADPVKPSIIGTHYIDLRQISNEGEKGFMPTFGPSFIHLYGSTRDNTMRDKHSNLNTGLGEGASYRARLLIAIRTEITDNIDITTDKNVILKPAYPITESSYSNSEDFFLFGLIADASMLDKKISDKMVSFELSMGNAGNTIDGLNESFATTKKDGEDGFLLETVDSTSYSSTTNACKPLSHNKSHYFLPYGANKPCMDVRCKMPDLRRRMYNSNMLAKMTEKLEDGLSDAIQLIENDDPKSEVRLCITLREFSSACQRYQSITKANATGPGSGKTKLDKERIRLCLREIENLESAARNLSELVTLNSRMECLKTAQSFLKTLKKLIDDPQHSLPDIFLWIIANGKRYAYHRIVARDLIYSKTEEECGVHCAKLHTIFLKLPARQSTVNYNWFIQAKLSIYLWLGIVEHKGHFFDGLTLGYDISQELRNAKRPGAMAPNNIHYLEKSAFQLRAHLYQARSLLASDASGLSDPYATVYITEFAKSTQSIEETLSPTWDELLVFDEILVYGSKDGIKQDPPTITIEIYDQDTIGKSQFIGRAIAEPRVNLREHVYVTPKLEWFDIVRGSDNAGELLAAFEMIELSLSDMPRLTEPKAQLAHGAGVIYPVPKEVRPQMARFKLEVIFWGLRDLKRLHLMHVDKPRIDIKCAGKILSSNIIQNARKNPNFSNVLKSIEIELPLEEIYAPQISIRCLDCRSFGRCTLVGTHQIKTIQRYKYKSPPIDDITKYTTIGDQIILPALVNEQSMQSMVAANIRRSTVSATKIGTSLEHDEIGADKENKDEINRDWWTKYFWSKQRRILVAKAVYLLNSERSFSNLHLNAAPYFQRYPNGLEAQSEFNYFREWLHSFPLYRGKQTGGSADGDDRIVGFFKGAVKVYPLPPPKDAEVPIPNVPPNEPIHVLVRVYIVKGILLHPMDRTGKSDPYIVLHLGSKHISDKDNYISKELNPIFGKCFEIKATFPQDSRLTVQIYDWDMFTSDDFIGETHIDLENRFYSKHRATCGLAYHYEDSGYNQWRDPMRPTEILLNLCKNNKLTEPNYLQDRVTIGNYCMTFSEAEVHAWNRPSAYRNHDEHLALAVLHRWSEIPKVGCKIVPEHIESRSLYNPDKPGIEQGKLEMWVDMFPMDMPLPITRVDISPRKAKPYELRVIIWNTDEVALMDETFLSHEKMSDIYVKGWVKGPNDMQTTDVHYRSLTGEGNFNWRFIFRFDYLAAEERIVLTKKEALFKWEKFETKIPARLKLQVWDCDHFSPDDFIGAITLDLNRFPRGVKTAKLCTLDMLTSDLVPLINIFKQKRVHGWWPLIIKNKNELELTGKVEAEIQLLTKEEAEYNPAGFGRSEPEPLEKPHRPDSSFMWMLNPIKTLRYIIWHNHKWAILRVLLIMHIFFFLILFIYSVPGYSVKRIMGV